MDIAPELLQAIQEAFETAYGADEQIRQLIRRIAEGTATYREAEEYAVRCGEFLAEAFRSNLSSDILPDGRMYFNIADRIVRPPMEHNHDLAAEYAAQVQQALNEAAGIRIRPQAVPLDTDRIDGIVNRLASESHFDDVAWILGDPVVNFTQNVVDESIRANADFHAKSGFSPKIVRTAEGSACKWCRAVAGSYDYDDVKGRGNEVWRRHENCRCLIEWIPGKGRRQTVYNYRGANTPEERERLEQRRAIGRTASQREQLASMSITNLRNEKVGRSIGAKWQNYDIMDLSSGEVYHLAEGTKIQDKEVFAGKGVKKTYDKAPFYAERYGGAASDWQHVKATGTVATPDGDREAEIHWSQCEGIGKKELFVKKWLD